MAAESVNAIRRLSSLPEVHGEAHEDDAGTANNRQQRKYHDNRKKYNGKTTQYSGSGLLAAEQNTPCSN
jgi:hypothetical protein